MSSELEKKLARRRTLNGEGNSSNKSDGNEVQVGSGIVESSTNNAVPPTPDTKQISVTKPISSPQQKSGWYPGKFLGKKTSVGSSNNSNPSIAEETGASATVESQHVSSEPNREIATSDSPVEVDRDSVKEEVPVTCIANSDVISEDASSLTKKSSESFDGGIPRVPHAPLDVPPVIVASTIVPVVSPPVINTVVPVTKNESKNIVPNATGSDLKQIAKVAMPSNPVAPPKNSAPTDVIDPTKDISVDDDEDGHFDDDFGKVVIHQKPTSYSAQSLFDDLLSPQSIKQRTSTATTSTANSSNSEDARKIGSALDYSTDGSSNNHINSNTSKPSRTGTVAVAPSSSTVPAIRSSRLNELKSDKLLFDEEDDQEIDIPSSGPSSNINRNGITRNLSVEEANKQNSQLKAQVSHLQKELREKDRIIRQLEIELAELKQQQESAHDSAPYSSSQRLNRANKSGSSGNVDRNSPSEHHSEEDDHSHSNVSSSSANKPARSSSFAATKSNIKQRLSIIGIDSSSFSLEDLLKGDDENEVSSALMSLCMDNDNMNSLMPVDPNAAVKLLGKHGLDVKELVGKDLLFSLQGRSSGAEGREVMTSLHGLGLFDNEELHILSTRGATTTTRATATASNETGSFTVEETTTVRIDEKEKKNLLFKDHDSHHHPKKPREIQVDPTYHDFIEKLKLPQSQVLVDVIRRFMGSVLGPNGDGVTPPTRANQVDYVFVGTKDLPRRCSDFFEAMQEHFGANPLWAGASEEDLICARDHVERYVMNRLAHVAFQHVETPIEDRELSNRMSLLSFLEPEALDIKPELRNDMVWAIARDELRKINFYKTPGEKVACVVKCASVLFRSLNLARAKTEDNPEESGLGADDFLPAFIYVVLKSDVPRLQSNCEYIQSFHNPVRLMSKSGYCFVNLRSAIEFILALEAQDVTMDPAEFQEKFSAAQALQSVQKK